MAGQQFQYDDSGNTFFYFLTSFVGLIVIPATYYLWPRDQNAGESRRRPPAARAGPVPRPGPARRALRLRSAGLPRGLAPHPASHCSGRPVPPPAALSSAGCMGCLSLAGAGWGSGARGGLAEEAGRAGAVRAPGRGLSPLPAAPLRCGRRALGRRPRRGPVRDSGRARQQPSPRSFFMCSLTLWGLEAMPLFPLAEVNRPFRISFSLDFTVYAGKSAS